MRVYAGGNRLVCFVEVAVKQQLPDAAGRDTLEAIRDLGIGSVADVRLVRVYIIKGDFSNEQLSRIARLLADPVSDIYAINAPVLDEKDTVVVQVAKKPGVMDTVALTVKKALSEMGLAADAVRTAKKFILKGSPTRQDIDTVVRRVLANETVEEAHFGSQPLDVPKEPPEYKFRLVTVKLSGKNDAELERISREGMLALNVEEMRAVQAHFERLGRDPTDCELETIAQTWSEHCVHKTFKSPIRYTDQSTGKTELIEKGLLKTYIMAATEEIAAPWCVLVFRDNAGIVEFDGEFNLCFKVETHNHPSAIEPYGGAATGIGGVIRDPLGTGLGALPVANTDVFCFGPPSLPYEELPEGCLHPKRIMKGVVAGVRDYGNRMGIPTVNGAVLFDSRYVGNPLVYCGNLGILPKDCSHKEPRVGDLVVLVGGRTGRDGIHGVTFASVELTSESEEVAGSAVQIGNPIEEKKLVEGLMRARREHLYNAITDCGGGGLSSAVGEMGAELGVEVHLERVPLKYRGLSYTEIWISEAQERMVLAVPPDKLERLKQIFAEEEVEVSVIGRFSGDKRLRLFYEGNLVADLDMEFLHKGLPLTWREAVWNPPDLIEPNIPERADLTPTLLKILSCLNVASKEWVVRQYDHEVQARTVVKPFVGPQMRGPSDGAVILPRLNSHRGVALTCGICPRYADIDPYWMAAAAIDEAIRNAVCLGADPDRIALLDNFSWGRVSRPEILGALVRCCKACYDFATTYRTPFISGKDSLNNEFVAKDGRVITIPHTLLISALGIVPDVDICVTSDLKQAGNPLYLLGLTRDELGGSEFYTLFGHLGVEVPKTDAAAARQRYLRLHQAIKEGMVVAAHDCSDGGLGVALAEMAFGGDIGAEVSLADVEYEGRARDDFVLFSESTGRVVVEVARDKAAAFERLFAGTPFAKIGRVIEQPFLIISGLKGRVVVEEAVRNLYAAWHRPLAW